MKKRIFQINAHIHTPYSFSSFDNIEQAFQLAKEEGIEVLGINDFYVTDGYGHFNELAKKYSIYPLFNIEFISLMEEMQLQGKTNNDPNNPGRTYISGKGLSFPFMLKSESKHKLDGVIKESQEQVKQMIIKTNELLKEIGAGFTFTYEGIKDKYAKELVRERHIAKALRVAINGSFTDDEEKKDFLKKLYSGKESKADLDNNAGFENELRGMLLKAGGRAFVPETKEAFLPTEDAVQVIIDGGGIPTYPLLLDNAKGEFTDFEGDKEQLLKELETRNIYSIEFIPSRNTSKYLEEYAEFFFKNHFLVTFGTEHNTPDLPPMRVKTSDGKELSETLKEIASKSTAVIAAHQHLVGEGKQGYIHKYGKADKENREKYIQTGMDIINQFIA